MVKYTLKKGQILKDGHTMFIEDVLADLKRKAVLEEMREKLKEFYINLDNCKDYGEIEEKLKNIILNTTEK